MGTDTALKKTDYLDSILDILKTSPLPLTQQMITIKIFQEFKDKFIENDFEITKSNIPKWVSRVREAIGRLKSAGLIKNEPRNHWIITNEGRNYNVYDSSYFLYNPKHDILSRANGILSKREIVELLKIHNKDFSHKNISWQVLNGFEFKDVDFSGSNLSCSTLTKSNFSGSDLSWSILHKTILAGSDLHDTNLSATDLSSADLRNANLRAANLSDSNLSNANLSGANLYKANLSNANFLKTDIYNTNFTRQDITSVKNISSAIHLINANFFETKITKKQYESISDIFNEIKPLTDSDIKKLFVVQSTDESEKPEAITTLSTDPLTKSKEYIQCQFVKEEAKRLRNIGIKENQLIRTLIILTGLDYQTIKYYLTGKTKPNQSLKG